MMASIDDWTRMVSTGRHQKVTEVKRGSTTLVKEGNPSIVTVMAKSRAHFPLAVSGIPLEPPVADIGQQHGANADQLM